MDLSKLSLSELRDYQKQLEAQLKNTPSKEMTIAEAMKAKPMEPPARMMERLREAVAQIPSSENASRAGKSETMKEMLSKMTPEARADVIARPDVMRNIEGSIAKAAPMETPYGKSFLSYTPEGKIKMMEDLKSVTKSDAGRGLGSLGRKLVGPAVAAGEVAAGENDIGKLAAGYVGADVMGELGAAAGGLLGKGPGAVAGALGGSLGGYAAGQKLYDKYAPEGVKKAMSISPEERLKVKQLLQDLKSKVKLTK
jgi:hypothetical protein